MSRFSRFVFLLALIVIAPLRLVSASGSMIGWAQEAYPDYDEDTFVKNLADQKDYGADLVWIGHNNPGYVDKEKLEPGLSYAVYEAVLDEKSPLHADAVEQLAAVKRLLDATRTEGLKAVLAIGYQIQMGPVWNDHHPDALRRDHAGKVWNAGGVSASYLSPVYQRDIEDYYRWVDHEIVVPYKDVLFMLNLADEPHGGDYSQAAEMAFQAESGLSFAEADHTLEGKIKKGHFENLYIAHYARWSAGLWKTIDPAVRVTMSFCGSHGRFINFEPSIAAIFRDTPDNFDITFDAFLIDNQPGDPIEGKHVEALAMFLRQVGDLSQRYHKRVWLWPEANNWILSQWSTVKGNISDALFGQVLLRNMSAAAGIDLGGLAVWNLDVKEQGLFRDTHELTYDPEDMFEKISGDFKTEADPVQLRDDVLVWIPESEADHLIGQKSYDYADRVYALDLYAPFLEQGLIPRLSSEDVIPSTGTKTVFLISKYAPRLTDQGYQSLDAFVKEGGVFVTNYLVLRPASFSQQFKLAARFYWNAIVASVTHKPRSLSLPWGQGRIVFVFGSLNERLRNIIREFPRALVDDVSGASDTPLSPVQGHGLLSFPQKKAWVFYNTNPNSMTVTMKKKSTGTLVMPDGTETAITPDSPPIAIPHGSWLRLDNAQ